MRRVQQGVEAMMIRAADDRSGKPVDPKTLSAKVAECKRTHSELSSDGLTFSQSRSTRLFISQAGVDAG